MINNMVKMSLGLDHCPYTQPAVPSNDTVSAILRQCPRVTEARTPEEGCRFCGYQGLGRNLTMTNVGVQVYLQRLTVMYPLGLL